MVFAISDLGLNFGLYASLNTLQRPKAVENRLIQKNDAPVPEGTQRVKKRSKQKVNCEIKNESIIVLIILKDIRPST